jgi:hypothetical protein
LDQAFDPTRQTAVRIFAAIVADDRAGQIFDRQHRGLIDECVAVNTLVRTTARCRAFWRTIFCLPRFCCAMRSYLR